MELEPGEGFASGENGVIGLNRLSARAAFDYQSVPILVDVDRHDRPLSQARCEALMRLQTINCRRGERYTDEDTGETHVIEYVSAADKARLVPVFEAALNERRDAMLRAMDAELAQELNRIERLYQDEALSLTMQENAMKRQMQEMKADAGEGESFQERFARKKAVADMEKQRREAEETRFMLAAQLEVVKLERMEQARERAKITFLWEQMFVLKWKVR